MPGPAAQSGPIRPICSFKNTPSRFPRPAWSPDGQWLSYVYPGSGKIEIYNLEDGRRYSLPNLSGAPASWSPGSKYLLLTDQVDQEDRPGLIHLFRFEIATEALIDLSEQTSGGEVVMDTAAAWSPDGAWITVVRREVTETGAVVGSQLWLMGADSTQARRLTTEPRVTYRTPAWSPDGTHLLFHRYSMAEPAKPPAIWRLNVETGEMKEIVNPGNRPAWIIP